jgi:NAD(P)-dependent dehydrogenase (short-subunit alcohol dehydrogenase family)
MRPIEASNIFVTGATDGLGKGVAVDLASRGATVLVHGRDQGRIDAALEEIGEAAAGGAPRGYCGDLSALAEVRRLGEQLSDEDRIDVLVNNAGIGSGPRDDQYRELSAEGYELRFAVNYLAPFLLTELLLPLLEASAPARIVNVASVGQAPIDFGDVMLERDYEGRRAYAQSKLALVMFTFELARRLDPGRVTANCLHPGSLMPTKIVAESWGRTIDTLEQGIDATVRLITDPGLDGVSGRYFDGRQESTADGQAYDDEARERLWKLSEALVASS